MSLSRNVFLRVFLRWRSDRSHSLDHRWRSIPAPPLQRRCIPYVSHHWRNAKCVCICCLPCFCSWHAAFERRSDNERLGQIKMCYFLYCFVVLTCRLPFLYVCPCRQSHFCLLGSGIFNQTSPPQLRPHGRSFALQLCKTLKKRNSADIIRFIMFVQHAEIQRSRNMQRYCQNIHGHFVLSFPSRANVVKVTHLNVTGSEALISWASGIKAKVPWRFKRHNA